MYEVPLSRNDPLLAARTTWVPGFGYGLGFGGANAHVGASGHRPFRAMVEIPFSSLRSRFAGATGWVVGRGPTRFRYEELSQADGPVFFVNDAVGQETWLRQGHPSFFFAHDASMRRWLEPRRLRSVPVLIVDQPETGPMGERAPGLILGRHDPLLASLNDVVLYSRFGEFDRPSLLDRSREEIARSGQLHVWSGTIHPLLHFAWYVGCSGLNFVGCDGLPEAGYDARLENRSQTRQVRALNIRVHQEEILRRLSLPGEHLGTPRHHVAVMIQMRDARANASWFHSWLEQLRQIFLSFGCGDLHLEDDAAATDRFIVTGIVSSIDPLVRCMGSKAFNEHIALEGRLDPRGRMGAVFKAVMDTS